MWLIDTSTKKLKWFLEEDAFANGYAILSHTWGDNEVLFEDIESLTSNSRHQDFKKIHLACQQAMKDEIRYVWIDTCCIDKSSSAELSEAINSMFRYYQKARICYAYLSDVTTTRLTSGDGTANSKINDWNRNRENFIKSKWFTRGWTLQELIAPRKMRFYADDWDCIGSKRSLSSILESITHVPVSEMIEHSSQTSYLENYSAARKMSWAAQRITSRPEDRAYSLLGMFDVNMPLLYGEGEFKAFIRLQAEILRTTEDLSLLLWMRPNNLDFRGILAASPSRFQGCGDINFCSIFNSDPRDPFELITAPFPQLRVTLPIYPRESFKGSSVASSYAVLNFWRKDHAIGPIALQLEHSVETNKQKDELAAYLKDHSGPCYSLVPAYHLSRVKMQRLVLTDFAQWIGLHKPTKEGAVWVDLDGWCRANLISEHRNEQFGWVWQNLESRGYYRLNSDSLPAHLHLVYKDHVLIFAFKSVTLPGSQPLVFYHMTCSKKSAAAIRIHEIADQDWTWIGKHCDTTNTLKLDSDEALSVSTSVNFQMDFWRWEISLSHTTPSSLITHTTVQQGTSELQFNHGFRIFDDV